MIQHGDDLIVPELKRLWKTCFEDEDAYIDDFFAALYKEQDVLLAEEDGVLMGASFFLPGRLLEEAGPAGRWQKIRYVYALAVYPQYRGKGIAGKLLRHAYQAYQAPLIAEPADEGLVDGFYKPLGFEQAFYLKKEQVWMPRSYDVQAAEMRTAHKDACCAQTVSHAGSERKAAVYGSKAAVSHAGNEGAVSAGETQGTDSSAVTGTAGVKRGGSDDQMSVRAADAISYARVRDAYFAGSGYVKWPVEHIAFALHEHRVNGGDALIWTDGQKEDLLLYYIEDGSAVVTETTLSAAEAAKLLCSHISEEHMPRTVVTWQPFLEKNIESSSDKNKDKNKDIDKDEIKDKNKEMYRLTGMIYGKEPVRGYLNLSLD